MINYAACFIILSHAIAQLPLLWLIQYLDFLPALLPSPTSPIQKFSSLSFLCPLPSLLTVLVASMKRTGESFNSKATVWDQQRGTRLNSAWVCMTWKVGVESKLYFGPVFEIPFWPMFNPPSGEPLHFIFVQSVPLLLYIPYIYRCIHVYLYQSIYFGHCPVIPNTV